MPILEKSLVSPPTFVCFRQKVLSSEAVREACRPDRTVVFPGVFLRRVVEVSYVRVQDP